jgi:hypothetical protein
LDEILIEWKTRYISFPLIYGRPTNSFGQERTTYLKLGLESISKVWKQKRHCFLKSYGFHSQYRALNAIENICGSLWLAYFTRIQYQIRRNNWLEIKFYFTRYQAFVQQWFFNNYFSWVFFTITRGKVWKIILDYCFIYFYYFKPILISLDFI